MPNRERTTRTAAIVLLHKEMGEADRLLTLYTEQLGKVRAIAKGVRRLRSRKAGHLEPFTYANLQLARGRDLMIVTQAETVNAYLPLRDDLEKVGQASYVIELVDRFTYDAEENSAIFRLIVQTLERLQTSPDADLVLRYYEMRLLDYLGFRPELQNCTICNKTIQPEDQYFSALHGGTLCPACGKGKAGARPISLDALRYLRHFQRSAYDQAQIAAPSNAVHAELEIIMHHYLTYLLERNLNTPAFMRKLRAELDPETSPPSSESTQ
jgi:DNA repair protein RecO (recombination protein O)